MPGNVPHHTDKMRSCVEKVMAQGNDESSAYAICTETMKKAGHPIYEDAEEHDEVVSEALEDSPRDFELRGAIGIPQFQQFEGREHIVVPVVALVEGVIFASNATAPEFVPQSTIQRMADSFNGRKVTVGHPVRWSKSVSANSPDIFEQQAIGTVFNARAEGKRLLCEAWIDVEKVKKIDPTLYDSLAAGRTEEVSVGVQVAAAAEAGTHNGKKYQMVWKSASGDHLAFLPGAKGACSVEMGCGTHRIAMRHCVSGDEIEFDYQALTAQYRALMPRGWGDDEVKTDITKALELIEPAVRNGTVLRVKNDTVTYVIYPPPQSYQTDMAASPWPMPEPTYWQRSYTFNTETQRFVIGSERTPVEPTVVYVPIRAAVANPLDRVAYEGGRWIVRSLDKKTKLGDHATRALAEEHARAIDAVLARLSVAKKSCTCATTAKHETGHECGCHKE